MKIIITLFTALLMALSLNASAQPRTPSLLHLDQEQREKIPVKDIQRFATVIAQIKRYYIENVPNKALFNNAIRGMLNNLDPHSDYLEPDAFKELQSAARGNFGGIGVEIIPEQGFIRVISPLDDTPAKKAGLEPGDLIVRINKKLVKDLTIRKAIGMIRGKPGTKVTLYVIRKDNKKPLKFDVTRKIINIKTVKTRLLDKHYGYVRIVFFQEPAKRDIENAIKKLKDEANGKLYGMIIDVRNNPGGLLDAAIDVADSFLDADKLGKNKLIVYTKGRLKGSDVRATANAGDLLGGVPMVVLVNQGSASASEIIAGALQDHKRAIVMGAKSFGKGSVQTVIPIDSESGIKLTTALYYTPKGRSIQAKGINPDVIVADLKIPKTETDAVAFDPIKEIDLDHHLENGNGNDKDNKKEEIKKITQAIKPTKLSQELLHQDYQLYSAVMLLKGMHVLEP